MMRKLLVQDIEIQIFKRVGVLAVALCLSVLLRRIIGSGPVNSAIVDYSNHVCVKCTKRWVAVGLFAFTWVPLAAQLLFDNLCGVSSREKTWKSARGPTPPKQLPQWTSAVQLSCHKWIDRPLSYPL